MMNEYKLWPRIFVIAIILSAVGLLACDPPPDSSKSILKNLATAQEDYFSENGAYSADLELLIGKYKDAFNDKNVKLEIIRADKDSWEGRATFLPTGKMHVYKSHEGGLQE
jgi:hypothetical protein